jgi:hypothetical protein
MTYTFKLARRLAVSRRMWFLPALVLSAACGGTDAISPDANSTELPESGIYGWQPRESTPVAVHVNPSNVTLETNQLIQFRARGRNRAGDDVVAPVAWSTTGGTILPDGRFSAAAVGTYQVTGRTRTRDDVYVVDTSIVMVVRRQSALFSLDINPASATLAPGVSQRFTAVGRLLNDQPVPVGVLWTATGGTIDPGGTYLAGDTAGTYRVIATNLTGNVSDTARITISAPPPPPPDSVITPAPPTIPVEPVPPAPPDSEPAPPPAPEPPPPPAPTLEKVTLMPSSATLAASSTKRFTAYGRNSAGDSVAVSVTFSATGGTVSSAGLYTAGRVAGSYKVIAKAGDLADTSFVTVTVSLTSADGFTFGAWDLRAANYGAPFNSAVTSLSPDYAWPLLDDLQAKGAKVFVNFAGGSFSNVQNPDGTFSYARWQARVDRFLPYKAKIQGYIDAGTIVGFVMVDEPHSLPSWGGHAIPFATIEQMAKYTKSLWPSLMTTVRANASWLDGAPFRWAYLDAGWAQYSVRKGNVATFASWEVAAAKAAGLGLVVGLNAASGGDGSSGVAGIYPGAWNMSATEVRNYGKVLIADPYVCGFQSYKYTTAYMSLPGMSAAMNEVAQLGYSIKHERCKVR